MGVDKRHADNGAAWDAAATIYERDEARDVEILRAGGDTLLAPEREILGDLSAWCERAIHLQCAGGSDTLSLWKRGAREVVGVDISARMIAVARRKSEALDAPAQWFCADVLATPPQLDGMADLVYTGRGALPWIMDLTAWAGVVHRLLKPGGRLFVFEGHPLDWVWDVNAETFQFDAHNDGYFTEELLAGHRWPAPLLEQQGQAHALPLHEHQWTLGQIVTALADARLQLVRLDEHPDLFWNQFPDIPDALARRLPHTFSLLMRKG